MAAYGSDDGFSGWLTSLGLSLHGHSTALSVLREIGSAYVDAAYGAKLGCSSKTGGFEQALEWPRSGHVINGQTVPADLIPQAWINASYRAAYLHATKQNWALSAVDPNRVTRREQVDTVSREFFAPGDSGASSSAAGMKADSIINGMVLPLLCTNKRSANSLMMVV